MADKVAISKLLQNALDKKEEITEEQKKELLDGIIEIEKKYSDKEKELKKIIKEKEDLDEKVKEVDDLKNQITQKEKEITDLKVDYIKTFNGEKEFKGNGKKDNDDNTGNPDIKIKDLFTSD